ncbi:MAG: hypothetical protein ABW128_02275, partial [Rhizorhabdus sp.]
MGLLPNASSREGALSAISVHDFGVGDVLRNQSVRGKLIRGAILSGASLIALPFSTVWAQDAVTGDQPAGPVASTVPDAYGDIVVTAQRREQSLQDVP